MLLTYLAPDTKLNAGAVPARIEGPLPVRSSRAVRAKVKRLATDALIILLLVAVALAIVAVRFALWMPW